MPHQNTSSSTAASQNAATDRATEELSHLEIIGSIVAMLNRGAKGRLAKAAKEEADLYASMTSGGKSHTTSILYGGGAAGVPWTAAYVDSIGGPVCDLRSNIAAESRAKIVYERLINVTDDPGIKDALTFLMTREVAHQKSFEKALYAIPANFPPGKLPGHPDFADTYYNMSQGEGDASGPWDTGEQWDPVDEREAQMAVDGADSRAEAAVSADEEKTVETFAARTRSDPDADPLTGADLGAGPGAGRTRPIPAVPPG